MSANDRLLSLSALFDKLKSAPKGECRYIRGTVERFDEVDGVVIVHIRNGNRTERFWTPREALSPNFSAPIPGEWVEGYLSPFEDPVEFDGLKTQAIFDLDNVSRAEELKAFDWFAAHPDGPPWAKPGM